MILEFFFQIIVVILSIVIHEFSHGAMANHLGDPTAKYAGRLTLNPLKHLDFFGSIIVPILFVFTTGRAFGWAKPVPINPYNFRDQKYGPVKSAFAGPGANLLVALIFGLILRLLSYLAFIPANLYLAFSFIVFINLVLAIFNLIPVPPLDGSHILFAFLPDSIQGQKIKLFLSRFGAIIIFFLIFFVPGFLMALFFIIDFIFTLITGQVFPF